VALAFLFFWGHQDAKFANIKTLTQMGIPLKPTTRASHGLKTCDDFFEKNSCDTQWVLVGYHGNFFFLNDGGLYEK